MHSAITWLLITVCFACADNYIHSETWLQLAVSDVEQTTNYLRSIGAETCDEIEELPKNMHWIQDPSGTVFNLQERNKVKLNSKQMNNEMKSVENKIIEVTIEIKAKLNKVWDVFTNPETTKQMGGYYDTEWEIGCSFRFKKTDGDRLTDGVLLEFQPGQLIKHNLYEPHSETVMAIVTYKFQEMDDYTLLTGKEELLQPLNNTSFDDASEGWKSALNLVKQLAEAQ